jgi:hypothetical protein
MFDSDVRESVLDALDGFQACWRRGVLTERLSMARRRNAQVKLPGSGGSVFFWLVNDSGRKVPLTLERNGGKDFLIGADDKGYVWDIPFLPETIMDKLHSQRLVPSLFTCFGVLSLARGVQCLGGYYQAEYLPAMQAGLVRALGVHSRCCRMAEAVAKLSTDGYLSGMQTVMTRVEGNYLVPAGPLEIIAGGGLSPFDLAKISALSVGDAHMASLMETLPDLIPELRNEPSWNRALAADCYCRMVSPLVTV